MCEQMQVLLLICKREERALYKKRLTSFPRHTKFSLAFEKEKPAESGTSRRFSASFNPL